MAKRSSWKLLGLLGLGLLLFWGGLSLWQLWRDRTEPVSNLTYQEIEDRIARGSSLTEAQLARALAELQGKKVRWTGTVEEVDSENMVFVDMDRFFYDVRFPLPGEEAVRLSIGDQIRFTGVIEQVERYWLSVRVELRSVEIEKILE